MPNSSPTVVYDFTKAPRTIIVQDMGNRYVASAPRRRKAGEGSTAELAVAQLLLHYARVRKTAMKNKPTLRTVGPNVDITTLRVRMPDEALKAYKEFCGGEREVYICGSMMGEFFVSPDHPTMPNRRLYPCPPSVFPEQMLDWEIC